VPVGAAAFNRLVMTSLTDPLTRLPGRRRLEQRLDTLYSDFAPRMVGLLVIDVDRFQRVNDDLGRSGGDDLLRKIGPLLQRTIAGEHLVVRLWSDEFAVLVERDADAELLQALAERVRDAFAEPFGVLGERVRVGVTIGGAIVDSDDGVWAELLHRADLAARRAKRHGTGYELYRDSDAQDEGRELLNRVDELREAIPAGQLTLRWQPQVEQADGAVRRVEALVRWRHPRLGLLAPHDFLLVAEAADLLEELFDEVLRQALGQLARWRRDHERELAVAVNLALPNVLDERLPSTVASALVDCGVPPRLLTLELPERAVIEDPRRALDVLFKLRALGVQLSLDDFGTGAASLTYLGRLPVDELKVDRAFVSRLRSDPRDAAVVRAVVQLGRQLDLRVVAEGVEDEETARRLRALGADALQGHHLCEPLPATELERWLDVRDRERAPEPPAA
jgi:diguanylate cyclase (GGDEF)-like protein